MPIPQDKYSSEAEWGAAAASYGSDVARTSAPAATELVTMAAKLSPIDASSRVLDVGAGTGAVTVQVLSTTQAHVTASDIHQSMLDSIVAPPGRDMVRQVADARRLTQVFEKGSFSHVFCTFMMQTVRNPMDVLREMHQILQPSGGVVGIACWRDPDPMDIFERACQTIDASYRVPPPFDDPHAWRTEEEVAAALREAGFKDVSAVPNRSPFPFESAEGFLDFWFGRKNPMAERIVTTWEGDVGPVKQAVLKIVREEYDNGRAITTSAAMGVGRA